MEQPINCMSVSLRAAHSSSRNKSSCGTGGSGWKLEVHGLRLPTRGRLWGRGFLRMVAAAYPKDLALGWARKQRGT